MDGIWELFVGWCCGAVPGIVNATWSAPRLVGRCCLVTPRCAASAGRVEANGLPICMAAKQRPCIISAPSQLQPACAAHVLGRHCQGMHPHRNCIAMHAAHTGTASTCQRLVCQLLGAERVPAGSGDLRTGGPPWRRGSWGLGSCAYSSLLPYCCNCLVILLLRNALGFQVCRACGSAELLPLRVEHWLADAAAAHAAAVPTEASQMNPRGSTGVSPAQAACCAGLQRCEWVPHYPPPLLCLHPAVQPERRGQGCSGVWQGSGLGPLACAMASICSSGPCSAARQDSSHRWHRWRQRLIGPCTDCP